MSLFGISGGRAESKGRISNGQAVLILMGTVLAFTAFVLPGPAIQLAGNDAYWSPYLATFTSILQMGLYWLLARRYAFSSPWDYLPRLLGPFLGKLVSLSYVMFFIVVGGAVDQEAGKVLGSVLMPLTPIVLFTVVTVLSAAYVAYLGMEVFGRLAQLMMPLLIAVLALVSVGLWAQLDFGFLLPVLRHGFRPAVRGAAVTVAMRSEAALVMAFLLPLMHSPRRGLRAGVLATCLISVFLVMLFVTIMCLMSPAEAARVSSPFLVAARAVTLLRGAENIEFFVIVPWLIALTLKVALYVHLAALGIAKIAGTETWRPLILPTAVLAGSLGGWMLPNVQAHTAFLAEIWPGYALTVNLLLPASLLVISVIFRRKAMVQGQSGGGDG